MYLNPDAMPDAFQRRVARWLEANGCRHHIALEPVVVRGNIAEYVALSRKDDKSLDRQIRDADVIPIGLKRLRIRIPLSKVA